MKVYFPLVQRFMLAADHDCETAVSRLIIHDSRAWNFDIFSSHRGKLTGFKVYHKHELATTF